MKRECVAVCIFEGVSVAIRVEVGLNARKELCAHFMRQKPPNEDSYKPHMKTGQHDEHADLV